ncbi:recombination mediator RecR [Hirschia baltica]|uniref:Recombination protein RecR n=1 Tax=Hirschia baltica (strain ATCC 49814 / DSM 5838 / IFAM 1418) TaxID=582402 RepID=C6XQ42_HIRBI|nr:recombination mediator RecR [Hirschia baltica]ACT58559.1 recombination protein RecR [Hirschia baltica ATCC 49814]
MSNRSVGPEITRLIEMMSKLPGMGPRSARRAALHLLKKPEQLLAPMARAMADAAQKVSACDVCGNFDTLNPCAVCQATGRDEAVLCVLADVGDLWAMERSGVFRGRYHVLGGCLSALDGIGPDDLNIASLISRAGQDQVKEVILALNATVDGQTTAHYVADQLENSGVIVSRLAHGVPVGGELGSLDDGTIAAAFSSRR